MTIDERTYRTTIGLFATGVTIISAEAGGEIHGMTANSVTSVSLDPLLLLVCVDRRAHMAGAITEAGRFAVSILRRDQEAISRHFAGRPNPYLQPVFIPLGSTRRLADCMAALACVNEQVLDGGDHIIVLARVEAIWQAEKVTDPLLYFGGQYRQIAPQHEE
ncbi:MAG: flavin reductase family protein [Oscillochloris sp.]|nr:flavin reductase family protein [Oscillochloris sp.]